MTRNDPFATMRAVPSLTVTSATVRDGQRLAPPQMSGLRGVAGGADVSPQLSWSGAPDGTRSYAVTMYDPDAPTGSGFWHWVVANIPATCTSLPAGAGDDTGSGLPDRAVQLRNDAGDPRYVGAAPPAGHGPHRYFLTVFALDTDHVDVKTDSTPAFLGFTMFFHTLARGFIVATAETPAS